MNNHEAPAWYLSKNAKGTPGTYLGGTPYLLPGEAWPSNEQKPLHLLLQLNLQDLPREEFILPNRGYLQVLYKEHERAFSGFSFYGRLLPEASLYEDHALYHSVPTPRKSPLFMPQDRIPLTGSFVKTGFPDLYLKDERMTFSRQRQVLVGSYGGEDLTWDAHTWAGVFIPSTLPLLEVSPLRFLVV